MRICTRKGADHLKRAEEHNVSRSVRKHAKKGNVTHSFHCISMCFNENVVVYKKSTQTQTSTYDLPQCTKLTIAGNARTRKEMADSPNCVSRIRMQQLLHSIDRMWFIRWNVVDCIWCIWCTLESFTAHRICTHSLSTIRIRTHVRESSRFSSQDAQNGFQLDDWWRSPSGGDAFCSVRKIFRGSFWLRKAENPKMNNGTIDQTQKSDRNRGVQRNLKSSKVLS